MDTTDSVYDSSFLQQFGEDPRVARARLVRELDAFEALWPDLQPCWDTPVREGAWSPAQVVEHVLKANVSFSKVIYLLRRDAPLPEALKERGVVKDGKAQAPSMTLPGAPKPLSELEPAWQKMRGRLLSEVDQTPEWHGRSFFQPFFGELDALGWLRVAAWHTQHHGKGLVDVRRNG